MADFSKGALNRLRAAGQGLTYGFGDELESAFTGRNVDDIRKELKQFQEQNPWENMAWELVGGLPTGGILSKLLRTNPLKLLSLMKEGAASGALYGLGSGEGDIGDRVKESAVQAGQAGVAAPLMVVAGRGAKAAGKAVKNIAGGGNLEKDAAQIVKKAVEGDIPGGFPEVIRASQEAQQRLNQAGVNRRPMVVDETGRNVEGLLKKTSGSSGPISSDVSTIIAENKGHTPEWLESIVRNAITDPSNPNYKLLKELKATRATDVEPLYQQAFGNRTPLLNQDLLDVAEKLRRDPAVFEEAFKQATRSGRKYPTTWVPDENLPGKMFTGKTRDVPGGFTEHEVFDPDLQFWDMVKRAIYQEEGKKGTDPVSLGKLRRQLMDTLDTHPDVDPIYKQARQLFSDQSDVIKATELGKKFHVMQPDEVQSVMAGFTTQAEREGFMQGLVNSIVERTSKGEAPAKGVAGMLTSPAGQEKLAHIIPNPTTLSETTQNINDVLKHAHHANVMDRSANAATGADAALQEALQSTGAAGGVLSGVGISSVMNALSRATKGYSAATQEELNRHILRMITDNPEHTAEIVGQLTKPGALDKLVEGMTKRTPAAAGVLMGLEEPSGYPER